MDGFEQSLHIDDAAFSKMREDADKVLQKLIKNMVEKDSLEGKLTITVDLSMEQEFIPNYDPEVDGESRKILIPKFSHKVGSMMQIKNEEKGNTNYDGYEMVWDEDAGEYVLKPIANTSQRTIFDADYKVYEAEVVEGEIVEDEQQALEGRKIAALPGPQANDEVEPVQEPTDVSEEVFDNEQPLPFSDDDEYGYEEPEEY